MRTVNQLNRMRGKSYIGFSRIVNPVRKTRLSPQNQPRRAREMGPGCTSNECKKSKSRFCTEFTQEIREELFRQFWEDLNWDGKKFYVKSMIDRKVPYRCTTKNTLTRKNVTFLYHLKINGIRKQVCKNLFLNTLALGDKQVRGWILNKPKIPGKPIPKNTKGGDSSFARKFLEEIPKLPSHYCRQETKKLYLEPIFRTKIQLFEAYQTKCNEIQVQCLSYATFLRIVEQMKIAIHQPKKDRCDVCCSHEVGNIGDLEYNLHTDKKNAARDEKSKDKKDAIDGKTHVITMDVQKVLLCPMLNASALYYKTKLIVHNFTVFDLATTNATCFLWDECQAELVASVFATCLIRYLDANFKDELPIVIWSDGCTSQNRNAILSNALVHYAVKTGKIIVQKYLEKGHTQMEVDSVHAHIENNLKGKSIFLPSDYVDVCSTARKTLGGYNVVSMKFDDFLDFSSNRSYRSIRPGCRKNDPHVTDIRQIKYNTDGTLSYKIEHQSDWIPFPRRFRIDPETVFPKLYDQLLPISKRKFNDLQELLQVIPENCHYFYKSLPCNDN